MTAKELLEKTLLRLDNGKKWGKFYFSKDDKYCAVGAMIFEANAHKEITCAQLDRAKDILREVVPAPYSSVTTFNDAPETTFPKVKKLFEDAIQIS